MWELGGNPPQQGEGGLFPHFLKTPPARLEVSVYVDLIKALSAAVALLLFGKPEHVHHDFSIRLVLDSRGSAALELAYDPVLQYTRQLEGLCGQAWPNVVFIDPDWSLYCKATLEHELAHIDQMRTYGLLQPVSYAFSPELWEPNPPSSGVPAPVPRHFGWTLLKIWLPIGP